MKKLNFKSILLAAVAVFGLGMCAQAQYASFFGDSITEWHVCYQVGPVSDVTPNPLSTTKTFVQRANDTTTIGGNTYFKIPSEVSKGNILLRENTAEGKLYRYYPELEGEYVICDLGLNVGDTFSLPPFYKEGGYLFSKRIVDSVWYNDGKKVLSLKRLNNSLPLGNCIDVLRPIVFTEGIGPNYGPFFQINTRVYFVCKWYEFTFYDQLLCMSKDDEEIFVDTVLGCFYELIEGGVNESKASYITLYPNPTDETFTIEAENITNVEIFDLAGQKVLSDRSGNQTINADNLTTGVYFLKVETQNGTKYGKLIKK